MLCARYLRRPQESRPRPTWNDRAFERLRAAYDWTLGRALAHSGLTVGVLLLVGVLNWYLLVIVPKGFFPQQDNGLISGTVQASQGHLVSGDATDCRGRCRGASPRSGDRHGRRGGRRQRDSEPGEAVRVVEAAAAAARERRSGDRPLAAGVRARSACRRLPAGGTGHPGGRPTGQRPIPVHASG